MLHWRVQIACLAPMHINTRRDGDDGKSGTMQVCIRMLQPRPWASCLPCANEVGYVVDNDEPGCKICWQGTNITSSITRSASHPSKTGEIKRKSNTLQEVLTNVEELTNTEKVG